MYIFEINIRVLENYYLKSYKMKVGGDLTKIEKLMCELIFNEKSEYEIEIMKYITEIHNVEEFTNTIVENLDDAGVEVIEQVLVLTKEKKVWILKIKRESNI